MPTVAEELAELKKRSLTKAHASKLQDAKGLSTPEKEESSIKSELEKTNLKNYTKDATAALNAGVKAVDQDLEFKVKQMAAKKEDMQKQKEAAQNLQSYNEAKLKQTSGVVKVPLRAGLSSNAPAVESKATAESAPTQSAPVDDAAPVSVETAGDDDDDDDVPNLEDADDVPGLEDIPDMGDAVAAMNAAMNNTEAEPARVNRAERKARRIMEKLGMKKVPGISQVTLKMSNRRGLWTIYKPDVFEKSGSYVVFGEARQGGGGGPAGMGPPPSMQAQQAQAIQRLAEAANSANASTASESEGITIDELPVEEEEVVFDESGVDAKDIELVMGQAGCSRTKAVKALKDNDGDLVNAIMSLTA
jgi:nascent polypeptide-associated complex subunit alpha